MNQGEQQYLDLLKDILENGTKKGDRTGTGTYSVFGRQIRFDLSKGFPLLTTKKVHLKSIIHELLWFLSGSTDVKKLQEKKVRIWNEWATKTKCAEFDRKEGDLGPVYGHQWRRFGATEEKVWCIACNTFGINEETGSDCEYCEGYGYKTIHYKNDGVDQIQRAVDLLKNNPDSRRILITGWNPKECDQVALAPCHSLFQFYVADNKLSCQLFQRSGDCFLGIPFNIASYALLTMMMAQVTGLELGEYIHTFGDVHIYSNHINQVNLQLSREPRPFPKMIINPKVKDIFDFKFEDFKLEDYNPHKRIKAPVAI